MELNIQNGQRFGRLTVVKELPKIRIPSGQINRVFLCRCDCGYEKSVRLVHLKRGRTVSCGCIRSGGVRINNDDERRLRKVYRQILKRLLPDSPDAKIYYNKGIKLCDEWVNNIDGFTKWALENGYKKGLVIDRSDNSKGYSPENCRWVTQLINANNRDNTEFVNYNGKKIPLTIILREKNLFDNMAAIRGRIKRGWNHQKAIDTPIRKGNYKRKN